MRARPGNSAGRCGFSIPPQAGLRRRLRRPAGRQDGLVGRPYAPVLTRVIHGIRRLQDQRPRPWRCRVMAQAGPAL